MCLGYILKDTKSQQQYMDLQENVITFLFLIALMGLRFGESQIKKTVLWYMEKALKVPESPGQLLMERVTLASEQVLVYMDQASLETLSA